jgi:hypothetical protein
MRRTVDAAAARRDEDQFYEIESVLLYVSEAMDRAAKARKELVKLEAPPHLLAAVETTETALRAEFKRLIQSSHFAASQQGQDQLAV